MLKTVRVQSSRQWQRGRRKEERKGRGDVATVDDDSIFFLFRFKSVASDVMTAVVIVSVGVVANSVAVVAVAAVVVVGGVDVIVV